MLKIWNMMKEWNFEPKIYQTNLLYDYEKFWLLGRNAVQSVDFHQPARRYTPKDKTLGIYYFPKLYMWKQ
jgi:hypothetical protein